MTSRSVSRLVTAAAASLGLYLLLAFRYPLEPSLATPRASWASMVEATGLSATWHIAIYLGLTLLHLVILNLLSPSQQEHTVLPRLQVIVILVTWLACSVVLMMVAPAGESHDIFDYIFRGRMMTEYQANPLVDVPAEFDLSTPYARYLAWRKNVDTYGPIWEASSAAVAVGVRQVAHWLDWWDEDQPVCPRSPGSCRLLMMYIAGYRLLAISLTGVSIRSARSGCLAIKSTNIDRDCRRCAQRCCDARGALIEFMAFAAQTATSGSHRVDPGCAC